MQFRFGAAATAATMLLLGSLAQAQTPAPYDWTGFYLMGGGGVGAWNADETTVSPSTGVPDLRIPMTQGGTGGFGTVGGGFDFQTDRFVLGAFANFDIGSMPGTIQDGGPFFAGRIDQDMSFAVGGRAGWLITPSILPYATAGFVDSHFSGTNMVNTFHGAPSAFSTPGTWRPGWFIGGGAEVAVAPGWSLRGEYRYAMLASTTLTDTSPTSRDNSITWHPVEQTFRLELAYKFGDPRGAAPPVMFPEPTMADWSGFYVSVGGGYGFVSADTTTQNVGSGTCHLCTPQTQGGNGAFGRGGIGYDYRATDHLVVGAFGDGSFGNMYLTLQDQEPITGGNAKQDWSWAVGGRVGWLVTPQILPFVSAGYTEANFRASTGSLEFAPSNSEKFSVSGFSSGGWFVGAGADLAITPGWFVRGEYRYASYGQSTVPDFISNGGRAENILVTPVIQTFALSLVYKFGGPFVH